MKKYNHLAVERKWQKKWSQTGAGRAAAAGKRKKFYALIEFPYPSGDGLHVGHIRSNTAMDIIARKRRAEGYNVLYPIGWDAFGLPTENYAIKTGQQPAIVTKRNTARFRQQLQSLGFSFDWNREINTTDPNYYRWTQWIFLQFYKHGLAYKARMPINWCPSCRIGLANEEAVGGRCERCSGLTEVRTKEQWLLAITKYADRLDRDLDLVDYPASIKTQQRNWIGRKEGVVIKFELKGLNKTIEIFTTRPDTITGVTFVAVAPAMARQWLETGWTASPDVKKFINNELARRPDAGEQTKHGLATGLEAVNPVTGESVPVWVASYVLGDAGTGAIMGVPVADERDREFATAHGLAIKPIDQSRSLGQLGEKRVTYKLRDWVFSRQRYWGEPIPMINCPHCGWVPVPEKDLPVKLPLIKKYAPTESGESPLAAIASWIKVRCPKCSEWARRETDTMPNWAGSSWYYLRYADPRGRHAPAAPAKLKYWLPVDWYNGGTEHTTLHLLYSRFWHKFLYDHKIAPELEPYQKRTSHGFVLAPDGQKMSKSRGNVINPDELVKTFGADALRLYEMFMGPFDQTVAWQPDGLVGTKRFLERVWRLAGQISSATNLLPITNATIIKVSADIEAMKFNTAVSQLMILAHQFERSGSVPRSDYQILLKLLSPFAPHITEELWQITKGRGSVHAAPWPSVFAVANQHKKLVTIVIQVNGKKRSVLEMFAGSSEEAVKAEALTQSEIKKWVDQRAIKKTIFVPNRLINLVVDN
ncbi:MAG: class I tRNA ligase family protein [Patescibacteria group bacterium]